MYRTDKQFMKNPATAGARIYVGNLAENIKPEDLDNEFSQHGCILGLVVQRGFGFIQYENNEQAQTAIAKEHGVLFFGKKMNVKQAIDNSSKGKPQNTNNQPQQQNRNFPNNQNQNQFQPNQQQQQQQQQQQPNMNMNKQQQNMNNMNMNQQNQQNNSFQNNQSNNFPNTFQSNQTNMQNKLGNHGNTQQQHGNKQDESFHKMDAQTQNISPNKPSNVQTHAPPQAPSLKQPPISPHQGGGGPKGPDNQNQQQIRETMPLMNMNDDYKEKQRKRRNRGGGGGGGGMNRADFRDDYMDDMSPMYYDPIPPYGHGPGPGLGPGPGIGLGPGPAHGSGHGPPAHGPGPDSGYHGPPPIERPERNDCEIIVVAKALTEYAEYIEQRLKDLGLIVDLLFPNDDVPIGRVLANISSRGCLYAILVTPQNTEQRSLTLNVLHGIPEEHRNMPIDDALLLITRNFDAYMRGEKVSSDSKDKMSLTTRHPEHIQTIVNLLAENRQLSSGYYDKLIVYLQERKELQYKFEVAEGIDSGIEPEAKSKQAELQNRIMNILNKKIDDTAPAPEPVTTIKEEAPLLTDPSVQKALDSLMLGDMFKNLIS